MKNGRPQAKDIDDRALLAFVDSTEKTLHRWTSTFDLEKAEATRAFPLAVVLAKCSALIKRGLMTGCPCGCYGGFELTTRGVAFLETVACGCCKRLVPRERIDSVYGVCAPCAFEQSLEHFPCDHGAEQTREPTT